MQRPFSRRNFLKTASALGLGAAVPMSLATGSRAATPSPSIFGSVEIRREGLKPFPKWRGSLDNYFEERKDVPGSCVDLQFNRCHYNEWYTELSRLRDADTKTQLKDINRFMNRHKYIVDPVNWGVIDYWATPGEFFQRNGDCEDYAIAKFLSLRALDVDVDDMRIFILNDLNLRVAHAILAVYWNNKVMILDNQLSIMIEARRIRHYQPIYSVNETGWWKHRPNR